jgi:hypothetical protein
MDDQRVPNLEGMDEREARRFLNELFSHLSPEKEYEIRHEDYVMEMPQSGERIQGRENMRAFQAAYPNPPSIQLHRVLVRDGLWIAEGSTTTAGGRYLPSCSSWSCATERCGGTRATTRSRS